MQKNNKWEKIAKARKILHLGETATINQVKQAYRELAKEHHPDTVASDGDVETIGMQELNDAYRILLKHCENHPVPLEKAEGDVDDEDWWMNRFGNDPQWGTGKKKG